MGFIHFMPLWAVCNDSGRTYHSLIGKVLRPEKGFACNCHMSLLSNTSQWIVTFGFTLKLITMDCSVWIGFKTVLFGFTLKLITMECPVWIYLDDCTLKLITMDCPVWIYRPGCHRRIFCVFVKTFSIPCRKQITAWKCT